MQYPYFMEDDDKMW